MQEELEAVDWYDQRVDAATDPELKEILAHNRDEEKEHFAMLLEWYRRRDATMDAHLKEYRQGGAALPGRDHGLPRAHARGRRRSGPQGRQELPEGLNA